jgi:hypothetical protein
MNISRRERRYPLLKWHLDGTTLNDLVFHLQGRRFRGSQPVTKYRKECRRQFFDTYSPPAGYPDEFKRECLSLYVNSLGLRAIERVKGVHHTTVMDLGSSKWGNYFPTRMHLRQYPKSVNSMNWKLLWGQKKQNLALDGG